MFNSNIIIHMVPDAYESSPPKRHEAVCFFLLYKMLFLPFRRGMHS